MEFEKCLCNPQEVKVKKKSEKGEKNRKETNK